MNYWICKKKFFQPRIEVNRVSVDSLIEMLIDKEVLRFGSFVLNSGRTSPYFFNLGSVDDGQSFRQLGIAYAQKIKEEGLSCDVLFGPAYKGIPIAVSTSIGLLESGLNVGIAYDRKEKKDHGEGGLLIGASLQGRVILIDDVLTSGKAIRKSAELIEAGGGSVEAVVIALDRKEKNESGRSAAMELRDDLGVPVFSLATIDDVVDFLKTRQEDKFKEIHLAMDQYRAEFCL